MQPSLFATVRQPRAPYQPQSATSKDAAERARRFLGPQSERVLAWFVSRGAFGGTQRQAAEALGIGRPSMCARVRALEQAGRLVKTTRRRAGCACYVVT